MSFGELGFGARHPHPALWERRDSSVLVTGVIATISPPKKSPVTVGTYVEPNPTAIAMLIAIAKANLGEHAFVAVCPCSTFPMAAHLPLTNL